MFTQNRQELDIALFLASNLGEEGEGALSLFSN
jgi:hypothetical protein